MNVIEEFAHTFANIVRFVLPIFGATIAVMVVFASCIAALVVVPIMWGDEHTLVSIIIGIILLISTVAIWDLLFKRTRILDKIQKKLDA